MKAIRTFWIEPVDRMAQYLRRFVWSSDEKCPSKFGYHQAKVRIEDAEQTIGRAEVIQDNHPHDDPRWPTQCEACGRAFAEKDQWQLFTDQIYRRLDTGEEFPLRAAPPGSLYNAAWLTERDDSFMKGYDGLSVHCVKPLGDTWCIDGPASNCTQPKDTVHRCWVRHGTFGEVVHVDKAGPTCGAGAGSIFSGANNEWHGFLDHGWLTETRGKYD